MIYDCFTFFNELDLLEIRLNELNAYVDKFVIVESNKTFTNKDKKFVFEENKERFKSFLEKIIHVKVTKHPLFLPLINPFSAWKMEFHQRNQIMQGLKNCDRNDIILISDVDEIPDGKKIIYHSRNLKTPKVFRQHMSTYFLNNRVIYSEGSRMTMDEAKNGIWHGTVIIPYHQVSSPQKIREKGMKRKKRAKLEKIDNGGWHFTYQGGVDQIVKKIESFAHQEFNNTLYNDRNEILFKINNGIDIFNRNIKFRIEEIDEKYPQYIQKIVNDKHHHLNSLIYNENSFNLK